MSDRKPQCPKCRTKSLVEKRLSDDTTRIDICPSCRGGWFDAQELATVLTVAVNQLKPAPDAPTTPYECPKCDISLHQIQYPETRIEVDVCNRCYGIWLDRGEFQRLNYERAKYQDKRKFPEAAPANMKEAATRFFNRVIDRFIDMK